MSELTDAAAQDLRRVLRAAPLPDKGTAQNNCAQLDEHYRLPGIFDESDRRYLVAGWSEKKALTSMLNYYRAIARRSSASLQSRISVPTLIQFGKRDPAEEPGLAEASLAECDNGRLIWLEKARHWIQREKADRVTANIWQFLAASPD